MTRYAIVFAIAALASLALTPLARRVALAVGAIDHPEERKVHKTPVPRLGGLGIFLATVIAIEAVFAFDPETSVLLVEREQVLLALLAGGGFLLLIGAIDDVRSLGPVIKLSAQVAAALVTVAVGVELDHLFGWELGLLSPILTVLWIVTITNAMNLMDGLDGLAAGIGVIICASLFAISIYSGNYGSAVILAAVGGALAGFLRYNFYPASIFMGDSGAYFLGFTLAVVSLAAPKRASAFTAIAIPLLALGLPLVDTVLSTVRRFLRHIHVVRNGEAQERYEYERAEGAGLFTADRDHIHHRLVSKGLDHRTAVFALYGICVLLGVGAFALVAMRNPSHAALLATFGFAAYLGIRELGYAEIEVFKQGTLLPIYDLPVAKTPLVHGLMDVVFVFSAWLGAHLIVNDFVWNATIREAFLQTAPVVVFFQLAALWLMGLYRGVWRYTGIPDLLVLSRAIVGATLASYAAVSAFFAAPGPNVMILDLYLLGTLVAGSRVSYRVIEHLQNRGRYGEIRVAIYGAGKAGVMALRELESNAKLSRKVVAFLDDDPRKQGSRIHGIPVHDPATVQRLINEGGVDELVIASAKIPAAMTERLKLICDGGPVMIWGFEVEWTDLSMAASTRPGPDRSLVSAPFETEAKSKQPGVS